MSVSPSLRAAARSVYRDLWRASRTTFSGDALVLAAFREKMRNDAMEQRLITDEQALQVRFKEGRDVAAFLRRNVVQAERTRVRDEEDGLDTYKIRLTEHSELGNNESIKNPEQMTEMPRKQRKRDRAVAQDSPPVAPSGAPRFYSQLKKAHKQREIPSLLETDLEETFVRGSGPGGQSINKTQNNVQLLHKPTGIRVSCQETRSLEQNRKLARRILLEKLDKLSNPGLSKGELQKAKQLERERRRRRKAKKKAHKKEEMSGSADSDASY
ncbi:hypothetical protein BV25DRAFT_1917356 [Artomyces pyxidatus]|uniref:Uncharacterized protein n=1 Tax=Artomyces pyxidatus TaxID=48021 RepID=A0ACB8SY72_9AGAM|nr:hypothetical protein BV25DRAFT_1917356 [Artomyces pyxidatus]